VVSEGVTGATDPLENTPIDVISHGVVVQSARGFVEQWRDAIKGSDGHDMAANVTTVGRFLRLIDYLSALSHSTERAETIEGWRSDMENAPRDGTRVLLGRFTGNPKADHEGFQAVDWYRSPERDAGFIGFGKFNAQFWPPTHWQPLPEPPRALNSRDGVGQ
jgi:hypothetical protein